MTESIETKYPATFREHDTKILVDHITLRHSVELVGMKRVGISNFLRFFLTNPQVTQNYLTDDHLSITVDLNDLVERELYAFWILTFKRIHDKAQVIKLTKKSRDKIADLFLDSIQTQDLFLTIENIRTALTTLVSEGHTPTLFLLRFDRLEEAATPQFLSNLQGLIDSTGHKLAYVFTSARPLDQISKTAFPRSTLTGFTHVMYLTPLTDEDLNVTMDSFKKRYNIHLTKQVDKNLVALTDGHVQYLQLALIILNENKEKNLSDEKIAELITWDERTKLLSEEIWESLSPDEKSILTKVVQGIKYDNNQAQYLKQSGILNDDNSFFNPLFANFVASNTSLANDTEFTKKEHLLFEFLKENVGEICDRDTIIHNVWPESEEDGVTDWTIDRLVSRLRAKLKKQNSDVQIVTIKTRGYKMTKD